MRGNRLRALLPVLILALGLCACLVGSAEASQTSEYQVGSYVTFGSYPQTASGTDDTPIEWLVLENDGETALLISRYALDCQPYNTQYAASTTWEQCTLRSWLNNKFYNRAFSASEKQRILTSDVSADRNPSYSTNPGNATKDNVFLLSSVEANEYFTSDEARMCAATDYAIKQGAWTNSDYKVDGRKACWWWLRSPGNYGYRAARILNDGSIGDYGNNVNYSYGAVRPCVRVRLSDIVQDENESSKTKEQTYSVGDYVTFGTYPQTTSGTDDTPIEWLVLDNDGETALLISRYGLDCQMYNTEYADTTWEKSTLRSWLNDEFYNRAFDEDEKQSLFESDVSADKNPKFSTKPGNATRDNVFLLSVAEAEKYFADEEARRCAATEYAVKQGVFTSESYIVDGKEACWWWLRSPGDRSAYAADVYAGGSIINRGDGVSGDGNAVRPCVRVWLDDKEAREKQSAYQNAESLRESGKYAEAYTIYATIRGYRDVDEKIKTVAAQIYQTGNYVTFGSYPQTTSGTDDTPIEWLVLESDGETALLISRYGLDCQMYNTEYADTTWEKSTLRSWLNSTFYNRAFSDEEKQSILTSSVSADKNPDYDTNPGNATKDNVFLLSIVEAKKYFTSNEARMCVPTDYAIQQGTYAAYSNYTVDGRRACWWWLRSPGYDSGYAASVSFGGSFSSSGDHVHSSGNAVRPCVRVRLF